MDPSEKPLALIVIGMAGSGKTTFIQRLSTELHHRQHPHYLINLDPAVKHLPYQPNMDIRDTVNYKELMEAYQLGPNGAIVTALNLYMTRFGQVMERLEGRFPGMSSTEVDLSSYLPCESLNASTGPPTNDTDKENNKDTPNDTSTTPILLPFTLAKNQPLLLIDTPGQLECFTWSASSHILTSALCPLPPTALLFIGDLPQATRHRPSFVSTVLYAVSVFYKFQVPLLLVWNKVDALMKGDEEREGNGKGEGERGRVMRWMRDWESVYMDDTSQNTFEEQTTGIQQPYLQSLHLLLDEFQQCMPMVQVSARTGEGFGLTPFPNTDNENETTDKNNEDHTKNNEKEEPTLLESLNNLLREYWTQTWPRQRRRQASLHHARQ